MSEKCNKQLRWIAGSMMLAASLILLFDINASASDNISIITKLDTNQMLIGDQVQLTLEVIRDKQTIIQWPELGNAIQIDSARAIEILSSKLDTAAAQASGMAKEIKTYTLTVFDSGYYAIPPVVVKYKTAPADTFSAIQSEALLLTVKGIEVDTSAASVKPIKEPLTMPFHIAEILKELIIGGLVLAAIAGVILYFSLRKKKPVFIKKFIRKEPPHEVALNKLRALDEKKIWQQGEIKKYYSELSDITREYVEGRFGFPALESTTDEIMDRIPATGISQKMQEDLRMLLQNADLVKFAKAVPLPDEHKKFMDKATEFVKTTRSEEQAQNVEVMEEQKA